MSKIHSLVLGSNASILVQLYAVDDDDGSNGINLTGATSMSAKAESNGVTVSFTTAAIETALTGIVKLDYATNSFSNTGTYDIQIQFTDSDSKVHVYPSEGNTLKLLVKEAIT